MVLTVFMRGETMKSSISMKNIARELNVSIVTVSKALNDKDGVSEELKKKIKDLADKMGYRYNMMAKSMRDGLSYNIGVIIPEHFLGDEKSYYFSVFKHLSQIMERYQYCAILQVLNSVDEHNVVLPKFYYDKKVDGLIVLGQVNKAYIKALQNIEIPAVFLDFYDESTNVDSITVDNYSGAYELTNYLIKNGHVSIAFVGDIYATSSIQDRFLGMCKSLLEHGIKLREDYVICDRDQDGKYIELKFPKDMPTAFVCNCDGIAYNLIIKLKEMGYSVPEDFSVVGFDNDIYATISEPQITTVEVDVQEMAGTAVKSILDKIKKENKSRGRSTIKGRIVYRDSVKKI